MDLEKFESGVIFLSMQIPLYNMFLPALTSLLKTLVIMYCSGSSRSRSNDRHFECGLIRFIYVLCAKQLYLSGRGSGVSVDGMQ